MSKEITFRAVVLEDVATGVHRDVETSHFALGWPNAKRDKTFMPRGGYSTFGELGTWTTTITALATSSAFSSIIIAWLRSKRRKVTLSNGNRRIEYEGPNPIADLKQIRDDINGIIGDEDHPTIIVYAEDLDGPRPQPPKPPIGPL